MLLHRFELFLDLTLVFDEAGVHVRRAMHVHPGFPIVQHRMFSQISLNENFRTHCQIEHGVGHKGNAVHIANPGGLDAADDRPRHECIDVSVCQNDETRAQSGHNSVFELVCEVRRVEQAQRSRPENISAHRLLEFAADEHGSLQTDVHRRIAEPFKPIAEHIDLRRASRSIRPFDDNKLAFQFVENDSRDSFSIKLFWFLHFL